MQNLVQYCQNGKVQDMPLSNEVLDSFCSESYQIPALGDLPSPNSSNPDLPASGRQSPFLSSLDPFTSGYEFPQMDGGSIEQGAPNWPMSTHIPIGVNNTSSASAPASQQHSPTSKAQHFVRHPSHLRYQIHPELSQYSQLTATATEGHSTGQSPFTMSSSPTFNNRQESPSYTNYQNVHHAPHKSQFREVTSAYNQSRGSPGLQNYQPFQESRLRSPVTSTFEQEIWAAESSQAPQYPEPQPEIQQQSDRPSYLGHHHISQTQGNPMNSYSSAQYAIPSSDSRNESFTSRGSTEVDFNGSSPKSIKREMSPPDSDCSVSTPTIRSQILSPKSQRKRAKRELKNKEENEAVVNPAALQTADLTNLDPKDQANVAALIDAMHNTVNVEDNEGMQKTWEKVRRAKAFRIKEVSVELLVSVNGLQCALEGSDINTRQSDSD